MTTLEAIPMDGLADTAVRKIDQSERFLARTLSVLSEEHSDFRPAEGAWTVAQQVTHTALTVDWFTEGAFAPGGFAMDFSEHDRVVAGARSLEQASKDLAAAFERARRRFGEAGEEALRAPMPDNPVLGTEPRIWVVWAIAEHTAHHRGSLATCARLLGLEPPMPYEG